jgi:hypothetical protein
MIRGEVAALAKFKIDHPLWSVRRVEYGDGYTGQRGDQPTLYGDTLAELHDVITGYRQPAAAP